jgi:hypothetical protein
MAHTEGVYDIPDQLRAINCGSVKYDIRQQFPVTAAVGGTRPGVSGATTGITTFQWKDDVLHWIPALSYFVVRGHFLDGSGNALARTSFVSYADNWCSTLFSQIQVFLDSSSLELLQFPAQADTAIVYSSVDKTWLKSFGTSSGLGEGFMKRCLNSAQFGTAAVGASNYNEVTATWRPALSIFDCAYALPPGPQWRIDFSWSSSGEQNLIESASAQTAGTNYTFVLDEFTLYKATVMPDPTMDMRPDRAVIELHPVQVNPFQLTAGTQMQVNVPLPATCHRMLICAQDNNTVNSFAAGSNGVHPITSFAGAFSNGATDFSSYIQNLFVNLTELGVQYPNPTYTLTAGSAAGSKSGWERAYADWIAICRGAAGGYEGSVPFGNFDSGVGVFQNQPLASTPTITVGDPENDQQQWIGSTTAGAPTTAATATARYGWLGRCPGPIFAIPVVRPPGKIVTNANMQLTMSGNVTAVSVFVVASYTIALAIQRTAAGSWAYTIVRDAATLEGAPVRYA